MTSALRVHGEQTPYYQCPFCTNHNHRLCSHAPEPIFVHMTVHHRGLLGPWNGRWSCVCGAAGLTAFEMADHLTREHLAECVMLVSAGYKPAETPWPEDRV